MLRNAGSRSWGALNYVRIFTPRAGSGRCLSERTRLNSSAMS